MSYDSVVLADSPVSYWKLNDPTGTTAADTGDSNPGTYTGGFTLGGAAPQPRMSGSTAFNGTTGRVAVTDVVALRLTAPLSAECWFKTSSGSNQVLVAKYVGGNGYGLAIISNILAMYTGDTFHGLGRVVNDGFWHHGVATLSGTTVTIHVDGVSQGTTTCSPTLGSTVTLQIGSDSGTPGAATINGSLSSPAVYPTALSVTQVRAHYFAALNTYSVGSQAKPIPPVLQPAWVSNLVVGFNLGEGSSTAADTSGNGHTGTLSGSCAWSSGTYGNQLTFSDNGTTGSYLNLVTPALSAFSGVTAITFSALCQLDTLTDSPQGNNIRVLIGTSRGSAGGPQCAIFFHASDNTIHFRARYGNYPDLAAPAPALNAWILITGRIVGDVQSIWYDGVKVAEQSVASFAFASDVDGFGALGDEPQQQTGNNWSGLISMALMAKRGYSDAEILALSVDPFVWDRGPFTGAPLLPAM